MKKLTAFCSRLAAGLMLLAAPSAPLMAQQLDPVQVQPTWDAPKWTFGIRASLNMANFYGRDVVDPSSDARPGGGAFVNYRLNPYFAVQPEVLYAWRAARVARSPLHELARDVEMELGYLDVPLLFKAYLPQPSGAEPHLLAGPFFSYQLFSRARDNNRVVQEGLLDDQIRSIDYGIAFGGGLDHYYGGKQRISLDARYTLGLARLFDVEEQPDFRNRGFTFTIGLGF